MIIFSDNDSLENNMKTLHLSQHQQVSPQSSNQHHQQSHHHHHSHQQQHHHSSQRHGDLNNEIPKYNDGSSGRGRGRGGRGGKNKNFGKSHQRDQW